MDSIDVVKSYRVVKQGCVGLYFNYACIDLQCRCLDACNLRRRLRISLHQIRIRAHMGFDMFGAILF